MPGSPPRSPKHPDLAVPGRWGGRGLLGWQVPTARPTVRLYAPAEEHRLAATVASRRVCACLCLHAGTIQEHTIYHSDHF